MSTFSVIVKGNVYNVAAANYAMAVRIAKMGK